MNTILKYSGVVALVILAITVGIYSIGKSSTPFGSTACSGITCLSGGLRLVTGAGGDFESDVAAVFTSTITGTSATLSGVLKTDGGLLQSNTLASTTMSSAATLGLADFNTYNTVLLTPNVTGDTTLTFPASSTVPTFLAAAGDMQKTCFLNATTTATVTYVFAGGTGFNLQVASSSASALGSVRVGPQKTACITFVRNGATATTFDINAAISVFN